MRALYALALIVMAAEAAEGNVWANFVDSDQELLKWIEAEGGRIDFRVGKTCPTCMRGAFAKKDFKGELPVFRAHVSARSTPVGVYASLPCAPGSPGCRGLGNRLTGGNARPVSCRRRKNLPGHHPLLAGTPAANEVIARIPLKTGIMLGHAGEWTLPGALVRPLKELVVTRAP